MMLHCDAVFSAAKVLVSNSTGITMRMMPDAGLEELL
jgi:hypothetical protein